MFVDTPAGAVATIRVTPRAGRTSFSGERDGVLLVKLAAAPVDGAANDLLITLLADAFRVAKREVTILSGDRARTKRILVRGRQAATLNAALAPLLPGR